VSNDICRYFWIRGTQFEVSGPCSVLTARCVILEVVEQLHDVFKCICYLIIYVKLLEDYVSCSRTNVHFHYLTCGCVLPEPSLANIHHLPAMFAWMDPSSCEQVVPSAVKYEFDVEAITYDM
jgi:hypothetical protein